MRKLLDILRKPKSTLATHWHELLRDVANRIAAIYHPKHMLSRGQGLIRGGYNKIKLHQHLLEPQTTFVSRNPNTHVTGFFPGPTILTSATHLLPSYFLTDKNRQHWEIYPRLPGTLFELLNLPATLKDPCDELFLAHLEEIKCSEQQIFNANFIPTFLSVLLSSIETLKHNRLTHGDIKPENIGLFVQHQPKPHRLVPLLLDWDHLLLQQSDLGIYPLNPSILAQEKKLGRPLKSGTPGYLDPKTLEMERQGVRHHDPTRDLYALGQTCATIHKIFSRQNRTVDLDKLQDFSQLLTHKTAAKRPSVETLRQHPLFAGVNHAAVFEASELTLRQNLPRPAEFEGDTRPLMPASLAAWVTEAVRPAPNWAQLCRLAAALPGHASSSQRDRYRGDEHHAVIEKLHTLSTTVQANSDDLFRASNIDHEVITMIKNQIYDLIHSAMFRAAKMSTQHDPIWVVAPLSAATLGQHADNVEFAHLTAVQHAKSCGKNHPRPYSPGKRLS